MDYAITRPEMQIVPTAEGQQPAVIAAILHGKYLALGATHVSYGYHTSETDCYAAFFNNKVTPAQFALIANSITKALTENTATQVYRDYDPIACLPKIEIKPGKDGEGHEIWVSLSVEFMRGFLSDGNDPKEFRIEFGKQVAEVFKKAMKGQLEYDEPRPSFLQTRIAAARLARKFVK